MTEGPLLAVDGSERPGSCALRRADGTIAEAPVEGGAVEGLPGAATQLLGDAGLSPTGLAAVVVGTGPGSYMGARAAVTFANGLTYAAQIPVIAVSSLDCAAVLADAAGPFAAVLDAGRGRHYLRTYLRGADGRLQPGGEPHLVGEDELPDGAVLRTAGAATLARAALELVAAQPQLAERLTPGTAVPRVAVAGQRDSWATARTN